VRPIPMLRAPGHSLEKAARRYGAELLLRLVELPVTKRTSLSPMVWRVAQTNKVCFSEKRFILGGAASFERLMEVREREGTPGMRQGDLASKLST
jgi:hypothetical protein